MSSIANRNLNYEQQQEEDEEVDEEEISVEEEEIDEEEEEVGEDEEDEEEGKEEVDDENTVDDEKMAVEEAKQTKPELVGKQNDGKSEEGMTEAARAVLAAKRRQEEEKLQDYEEKRREERERVNAELRSLREKQERRRLEREREERELAERLHDAEERRRQEEEESRARIEQQKQKRDEERRKKQAVLAESLSGITASNGTMPNFVIKKNEKTEKHNGTNGRHSQSREDKAEAKRAFLASIIKKLDPSQMMLNDLKAQIMQMYKQICELEASKYDLEKRHESQLYDLKELHERELQIARHRALQRGLDPNEAAASRHPWGATKTPAIAHGTARPPPDWGRTENEELEQLRRIIEPRKYVEQNKVDARPPIRPIPLSIPTE